MKIYLTVKPFNTSNTRNIKQRHVWAKALVISVLSSQKCMKTKTRKDAPFNFTKHLPKGGLKIAMLFYLAVNNVKERNETQAWFTRTAVGVNKLYAIMKTMALKFDEREYHQPFRSENYDPEPKRHSSTSNTHNADLWPQKRAEYQQLLKSEFSTIANYQHHNQY